MIYPADPGYFLEHRPMHDNFFSTEKYNPFMVNKTKFIPYFFGMNYFS